MAKQGRDQVQYKGVPQTPTARQHKIDQKLCQTQKKLELAMHLMVHQQETQNPHCQEVLAAAIRSAWEDLLQQRRTLMAGRQASKLEAREDDNRARLLSKEEEEKVEKARSARARIFSANPNWRSRSVPGNARPYSFTKFPTQPKQGKGNGKGKGTGKGKGKSNDNSF